MDQVGLKRVFRAELLERRRAISVSDRENKSLAISKRLASSDQFQISGLIHFYLSNRVEVQTHRLIQKTLAMGNQVVVPVIDVHRQSLFFSELSSLHPGSLETGPLGIRQPRPFFQKRVQATDVALWIIPGLGFDPEGMRIGYGGGYYDKVLKELKAPVIGLAFDVQIVDRLPRESTDRAVDQIMTETRTIFCRKEV